MTTFIEWLEERAIKDSKVRADLRRSLAFDPGKFWPACRYVEPFLKADASSWDVKTYYLVAGLWAAHWRFDRFEKIISIAEACAKYMEDEDKDSLSTESRFISVLDSDTSQLPYRLRQLVALLKDYSIDFEKLLGDLLYWNTEQKSIQKQERGQA